MVRSSLNWLVSLRSKRFRGAKSEERAKNGGFGVLPARKMGREPYFSPHILRGQNAENPVLRSLLHGNACYAGYWLVS